MIKVRLLLLAERLEKIEALPKPERKRTFDLGTWVRTDSCGTAACAVGEATFIQRFRDLGLRFGKRVCGPTYKGSNDWDAVQRFFGIDYDQAMQLFTSRGCYQITGQEQPSNSTVREVITPGVVARKIRGFVETGAF
jgi:hypothetical protein